MEATDVFVADSVRLSEAPVTMALTEAGLLVDRMEAVVNLYAEHLNWGVVKEVWHEERISARGSRASAQQILRIIKKRLQAGGSGLPSIPELAHLLDNCDTQQAKAQIFYLYFLRADPLGRYVVQELLKSQGLERSSWDLSHRRIGKIIDDAQTRHESTLSYAASTLERWIQGLRSVFRDIGTLKGPYDEEGRVPLVESSSLHVSALYSWKQQGDNWVTLPLGWCYLFQPASDWPMLQERLLSTDHWEIVQLPGRATLEPRV